MVEDCISEMLIRICVPCAKVLRVLMLILIGARGHSALILLNRGHPIVYVGGLVKFLLGNARVDSPLFRVPYWSCPVVTLRDINVKVCPPGKFQPSLGTSSTVFARGVIRRLVDGVALQGRRSQVAYLGLYAFHFRFQLSEFVVVHLLQFGLNLI